MQLEQITMDKDKARKAFLEYRGAVRERHDAEDEQIMRGYRALARGHQVINLPKTILAGGLTEFTWAVRWSKGGYATRLVPRLAAARASATMCWTHGVDETGKLEMRSKREITERNNRDRVEVSGFGENLEHCHSWARWSNPELRAIVPTVPPALRPKHALTNYHILFEAEWGHDPAAPVDPALLKRIGGALYAVVAIWDLTELERAVLGART
jgi:hypothetical protein